MKDSEYRKIVAALTEGRMEWGRKKGEEYANDENDRFNNFRSIGGRLGLSPYTVLLIYLNKHIDSINHFVRSGMKTSSDEHILGRIQDVQNYLDLMIGMLVEDGYIEFESDNLDTVVRSLRTIDIDEECDTVFDEVDNEGEETDQEDGAVDYINDANSSFDGTVHYRAAP